MRDRRLLVLAALLLALLALASLTGRERGVPEDVPVVPTPPGVRDGAAAEPVADPFAWAPEREQELERRAAVGAAHPLYVYSPGGAPASAARTARWRPLVERAAADAGVGPDLLEGLVLLESGGREDAVTPAGTEGAVGLAQILAETAQNLLGLRVDVERSARYSRRIARAERRGQAGRAAALRRARRRVDQRYDGRASLAAAGRYLALARERFGREDLAIVAYHMGMGNLESVLRDFTGDRETPVGELVDEEELSYARVYFDSTPVRHPAAHARLSSFGDDSANYLWKVHAGREIMRLHREEPEQLARLAALHGAKNSAEEVLHPPEETQAFAAPADLREAWDADEIVALPDRPALTGLRRDPRMGELAGRLRQPRGLYRGLRPAALAGALYIAAQVRALSGEAAPLVVTSTVRDAAYQGLLVGRNREATRGYSLHTTGWAFDVARDYASRAQARAFQFVLDRLELLGVIAWVREPGAIHITVGRDAEALLPLLERLE